MKPQVVGSPCIQNRVALRHSEVDNAENPNLYVVRALDEPLVLRRRLLAPDPDQRNMAKGALPFPSAPGRRARARRS